MSHGQSLGEAITSGQAINANITTRFHLAGEDATATPTSNTALYPFLVKQPSTIKTELTSSSKLSIGMQSYTLTDTHNRLSEVFEKAVTEPVLVIEQSRPSHVIMSADTYQRLLKRLEELEDMLLGQAADTALKNSQMIGVETFTATLQRLANGEA